jgi:hypothetical protein
MAKFKTQPTHDGILKHRVTLLSRGSRPGNIITVNARFSAAALIEFYSSSVRRLKEHLRSFSVTASNMPLFVSIGEHTRMLNHR